MRESREGRRARAVPGDTGPAADRGDRPGSEGEHRLQEQLESVDRADRFYDEQMLDHLNARMRGFVARQEMCFLATADARGECDNTFRAGPPGFLHVVDERTVVWPEYRGNGVHASLGNIRENPHVGILMVDFLQARIGLHVNGRARLVEDAEIRTQVPGLPEDDVPGRRPQMWVRVEVEEAYIHCAKHIPQLQKAPRRTAREWGTDDYKRKGGDFFGTAREARAARAERTPVPAGNRTPESAEATLHMRMVRSSDLPRQRPAPEPGPPQTAFPVPAGTPDPPDLVQVHSPRMLAEPAGPGGGAAGLDELAAWRRQAEEALAAALEAEHRMAPFQDWFAMR